MYSRQLYVILSECVYDIVVIKMSANKYDYKAIKNNCPMKKKKLKNTKIIELIKIKIKKLLQFL